MTGSPQPLQVARPKFPAIKHGPAISLPSVVQVATGLDTIEFHIRVATQDTTTPGTLATEKFLQVLQDLNGPPPMPVHRNLLVTGPNQNCRS